MRDNRIKELILGDNGDWSGATVFSAENAGITVPSKAINGEILSVDTKFHQNGSLALTISGTGVEFWRLNASSGAAWIHSVPREFGQLSTGSIASASMVPYVVNGPIILTTGSLASGLSTAALQCVVKYR